ncbi:MAG TPA: M56 family metallopeptidase [Candidatus Sulfotelmatobacter sp.]|nr:M56 family metallopeptidase [Candidatus Sulfotelmatobacter sp.]
MIQSVDRAVLALVSELVASGARSFVVAGVAAAGLAAFRPKATSLRLLTWTAVLYASLALPLLGWLLPPVQVSVPQFLQHPVARTTPSKVAEGQSVSTLASNAVTSSKEQHSGSYRLPSVAKESSSPRTQSPVGETASFAWASVSWGGAAWIYVVVTLLFLARFVAGIIWSGKLVRSSRSLAEGLAIEKFTCSARGSVPRLATSNRISVPVTVGAFWPTVLLPADWREWDAEKLDAVLAHEFSHVVRRDALTQRISLLYRAIFWFNPLAWWMNRHLAELAEQASDEAALSGGADQNNYARTLLSFFEVLQTAPGRIRWQGVSIARPGQAEQRLERILAWKGTITMSVKRSLVIAILVLAIPVVYLAASVHPANAGPAGSNTRMWQESVPPVPPPAPPVRGISAVPPIHGIPSTPVAPIAPMAPTGPTALLAPSAPVWDGFGQRHSSGTGSGKGFSYAYGFDDEERFVIVSGKSDSFTMSGSTQDARHVENLKKQIPGDFIWFQRDEKSYIIRDQATIDRARGFWAGQEELGKKQEELGKQQEALGKQQEELGSKMEQVRVNVPDLTAALDKLKAKLQKLGSSATMEQIGDLQSEIGELQSKIGDIQSHAGEEQSKLGELQGELGEKQGKLGEQQGKLGEQQAEIAEKATRQMKELLDESIKNGTAKPEEETIKTPTL